MKGLSNNHFRHLLSIESLTPLQIDRIFRVSDTFIDDGKVKSSRLLEGVKVVNLFFEPSTRTRVTFEIAAKNLAADVINLNPTLSSSQKGESLMDTFQNLEMMGVSIFIIRHSNNGVAHLCAQHVGADKSVVNAGDGNHAHPTQALLDMATLRRHRNDFEHLKIGIVGDILHSRVARSQISILKKLGVPDIRVIAPHTLVPKSIESLGVKHYVSMKEGLRGVDVILSLRLQKERMESALIPSEREFFHAYGITKQAVKHASENVLIMHPGPVNRGVEIDSDVVNGKRSLILNQVAEGVAIRMAVMALVRGVSVIE